MPFRDIVGHESTLRLLARAVALGSLPPSLIFTGPRGVGKQRAAVALAQALNCLSPKQRVESGAGPGALPIPIDACGECSVCRRIARGIHPDVVAIGPDEMGNIKVEIVRELNETAAYRPFEGRRRVAIIDDADALLDSAQNALLKTLEEPPSGSVFVLVTSRPDELLPTVRSRCPHVRFAALSADLVAAHLERVHGVPPLQAHAVAAASEGSIGVALAWASEAAVAIRDGARRMLEQLARSRDPRGRLAAAQSIVGKTPKGFGAGERESVAMHLRVLHTLLRDLGVLSTSGDDHVLANADLKPVLVGLLPAFDRARLVNAFTAVHRALEALAGNASPKVVADWVALQI
jgi:DNA polymerase-3 subunit delta'